MAQNKTTVLPFILVNAQKLQAYRTLYKDGNAEVAKIVEAVLKQADEMLPVAPYSVTYQKAEVPPSGDVHDYVSRAPYWWPDSSKPDGKPYIRKDGLINPERSLSKDNGQMVKLSNSVKQLALAYYFTHNDKYAEKVVTLLKVWFIDTATRMNPNLEFGQYIPGINNGRGIGIIETAGLTNIPDALAMIQQGKKLDVAFIKGIRQWFAAYVQWLISSGNGKDERSQKNNHGTYYDMQLADYALFTGDKALARKVINEQSIPRMNEQFTVDGAQPLELSRTKSWSYAVMNLTGWCKLATIADRVNIDLWHTQTTDGKSIRKTFEWFVPYLMRQKTWDHEQIEPIGYDNILVLFEHAAPKYTGGPIQRILESYPEAGHGNLWW